MNGIDIVGIYDGLFEEISDVGINGTSDKVERERLHGIMYY